MKLFDQSTICELITQAENNKRKRINYNFHETLDDPFQRLFNVMLPETYVRPHRHSQSDRWELFTILEGEAYVVIFSAEGKLLERHILSRKTANLALEIPANTWHSIAVTQSTVLFECKPGPYQPLSDKDFASWAPTEQNAQIKLFIDWYITGELGSLPPTLA